MQEIDIETERLSLGELFNSDVAVIVKAFNNDKIKKGIVGLPPNFDEMMAQGMIDSQEYVRENMIQYIFAIRLKGELVGCVSLANFGVKSAEIGYWIVEKHWGNGYATESAKAVKEFAIKNMGIKFLTGMTKKDNKASISILSKLGMVKEIVRKDTIRYGLVNNIKL